MGEMVVLDNLQKHFEITKGFSKKNTRYVKAVDNISLTINEGEIVGLVGESGSGKTTLARVILSLSKKPEEMSSSMEWICPKQPTRIWNGFIKTLPLYFRIRQQI